jgi:hypothetical protein
MIGNIFMKHFTAKEVFPFIKKKINGFDVGTFKLLIIMDKIKFLCDIN